ncbi:hypothetical protein GALMADRAFT_140951 [Galerina marginata CBS 339.88]|uniref:HAT C-terminal dimerisation domain-containing protein n=1 Tax=Galerina marginata (strain CBS 339.88) TaxID=685588 RepID=A0A067T923_GALM3|nr:hypothetical protein GALMADRAFT_140951 [Galerina marginata CBS 339.88]
MPDSGMEDILHVSTFQKVTLFLLDTVQKEIVHGDKPELICWKGRAGDFKKTLLNEMKRYAHQQYPFNQQIDGNHAVITWWQALQGSEHAQILPILAIKIFSVHVNSMPEERTVSAFTWISPPLRLRILVRQMAWRTKVRQYYATETKPCKNSAPKPMVKFYDVKSRIFLKSAKKASSEDLPDDDEDDTWLDEPQDDVYDSVWELDAEKSSPINLASKHLAMFLADAKESSATTEGLHFNVNKPEAISAAVQDDNDFSMVF